MSATIDYTGANGPAFVEGIETDRIDEQSAAAGTYMAQGFIRLGVGGSEIKNNAGVIEARTNGDAGYAHMRCNNLVVDGDLTVNGTTTTIDTTTLRVEDNIIEIARLQTDPPAVDAGIEVQRGGVVANARLLWVEADDHWYAGIVGSMNRILVDPTTTTLDMLYRNAAGDITRLATGTALQVLRVNAGANGYEWYTPAAGTTVNPGTDDYQILKWTSGTTSWDPVSELTLPNTTATGGGGNRNINIETAAANEAGDSLTIRPGNGNGTGTYGILYLHAAQSGAAAYGSIYVGATAAAARATDIYLGYESGGNSLIHMNLTAASEYVAVNQEFRFGGDTACDIYFDYGANGSRAVTDLIFGNAADRAIYIAASGTARALTLHGSDGLAATNPGGDTIVRGGDGNTTGAGGALRLRGGTSTGTVGSVYLGDSQTLYVYQGAGVNGTRFTVGGANPELEPIGTGIITANNLTTGFDIGKSGTPASANVTTVNLNTLTAGATSDASALHTHNSTGPTWIQYNNSSYNQQLLVYRGVTNDNSTWVELTLDGASLYTASDDSAILMECFFTGRDNTADTVAAWRYEAVFQRDTGVGSAAILNTIKSIIAQNLGANADVRITADAVTNGTFKVEVRGGHATNTQRWVCGIRLTEVKF